MNIIIYINRLQRHLLSIKLILQKDLMEKVMTWRYNDMRIEVKSSPETLQPQCGTCRLALQKSPHCEHLLILIDDPLSK